MYHVLIIRFCLESRIAFVLFVNSESNSSGWSHDEIAKVVQYRSTRRFVIYDEKDKKSSKALINLSSFPFMISKRRSDRATPSF